MRALSSRAINTGWIAPRSSDARTSASRPSARQAIDASAPSGQRGIGTAVVVVLELVLAVVVLLDDVGGGALVVLLVVVVVGRVDVVVLVGRVVDVVLDVVMLDDVVLEVVLVVGGSGALRMTISPP